MLQEEKNLTENVLPPLLFLLMQQQWEGDQGHQRLELSSPPTWAQNIYFLCSKQSSASQTMDSFSATVVCRHVGNCLLSIIFIELDRHKKLEIKSVGKCFGSFSIKREILCFNCALSTSGLFYVKQSLSKTLKYL